MIPITRVFQSQATIAVDDDKKAFFLHNCKETLSTNMICKKHIFHYSPMD